MNRDLSRLFRPRSLAVLGGSWAESVVAQSLKMGFAGAIWPVSPTRDRVGGVPAFRSLGDLPGAPDAAFIGINRTAAVEAIRELAALGAGGAICFASGFAEAGDKGLQAGLVAAAGEMPVLGPNCYGVINYLDGASIWPDQHGGRRVDRGVALISQSSNIAVNLTMQARGLPVAYVACVGNAAQTGTAEIARSLLADDRVTALGLYLEGIGDAGAFHEMALDAARRGKPIVAIKSGKTPGARAAADSHTAALAGGGAASAAFLARCGIAEVNDLPELVETLKFLHLHGWLRGDRVVSMSCSGGEAGLVADLAAGLKLTFPPPPEAQARDLAQLLGPIVTIANPFDYHTFIWGDGARMQATYAAMMRGGYDAAMLVLDFPHAARCDASAWEPALAAFKAAAAETGVPALLAASLPENLPEARADDLMAAGVVPVGGLSVALKVLAAARRPDPRPWTGPAAREGQGAMLDEAASKALLARAGIAVPQGVTGTSDTILGRALTLTAPLALKGLGLAHKSEAGAVRLGLYQTDLAAALALIPAETYLAEEMVTGAVAELLVGLRADPVYGATLTLGIGGVEAELLNDTATLLLPVTAAEVAGALADLRLAPLLAGYRGRARADTDAVAAAVLALQDLFLSDPALREIEINPLMVRAAGQGAVAADALIRRLA